MARNDRKRRSTRRRAHVRRTPGVPPGTLFVEPSGVRPTIRVTRYSADRLEEVEAEGPEDLPTAAPEHGVVWIDIAGAADKDLLQGIASRYAFHPLAIEDVAHLDQRAKVEPHDPYTLLISRAATVEDRARTEQVSLFVARGIVVSFQERPEDTFAPVRTRLREGRPRLREGGADYLAYALLDLVIDSYFPALEKMRERLEQLEEETVGTPDEDTLRRIQESRSDLRLLQSSLWPHREMLTQLLREGAPFGESTRVYLRDVQDHALHLLDLLQGGRELGAELMAVYMSQVSNRMNEVMKVLTMIATVFIPLGFVAGVYGMNFDREASPWNMPELGWAYGYPAALGVMAATAVGFVIYFVRKGWFR